MQGILAKFVQLCQLFKTNSSKYVPYGGIYHPLNGKRNDPSANLVRGSPEVTEVPKGSHL